MTTETTEVTLKAKKPPVIKLIQVAFDQLVSSNAPPPSRKLINSVKEWGVIVPLLVYQKRNKYHVIDGRRRAMALKKAVDETNVAAQKKGADTKELSEQLSRVSWVNAIEYEADHPALTVMLNVIRAKNVLTELEAINDLLRQNQTEKEIAKSTGLTVGTIRGRLKLNALLPEFKAALEAGSISVGVASALARFPKTVQRDFRRSFKENGRVTASDIRDFRTVNKVRAVASLPFVPQIARRAGSSGRLTGPGTPPRCRPGTGDF